MTVSQTVVPALGHDIIADSAVAPTCTTTGLTAGSHCSRCNDATTAQETVPARGHDIINDAAVAPTCTTTGLTAGSHCSRCDAMTVTQTVVDALGHDEVPHEAQTATCTEGGHNAYVTCSRCDYTTYEAIEALGHDEVAHSGKTATCTDGGWQDYVTCRRCSYNTYEEVDALGHDIVIDKAVEPTCTETGLTEGSHCSRCNGATVAQKVIPATGHDFDYENGKLTRPTATSEGYYTYYCINDGSHTETKAVVRADYTAYNEVIESVKLLLQEENTVENRAKLQSILDTAVEPGYIEDEQTKLDKIVADFNKIIAQAYPDMGFSLVIVGLSQYYSGAPFDIAIKKVKDDIVLDATDVTWTSSDENIVFCSNGRFYPIGTGTVTITATSGLLSASKTINIVEGGNTRVVKFATMDKMHFVIEDTFITTDGLSFAWSNEHVLRFRVHIYQNFPYETYIVYVNGEEVHPDADGYYVIAENDGDVRITIAGGIYDDDDTGTTTKFNFWEWLLRLIRKITNFFKSIFGLA